MDIYELREKYMGEPLDETGIPENPFLVFRKWYDQAKEVNIYEPNAFALATIGKNNMPAARMLLLKDVQDNGFSFFTNYESRKAIELQQNPQASMVFFWSELERQVRISGHVEKLSKEASDKYFQTRPAGSRLGAWASPQSKIIDNREWLIERHNEFRERFKHGEIPRPENWGGFILKPVTIEFWQGRLNRLHDRIEFLNEANSWKIRRLAP
jgi:pyridoxamine 5'-phosphate oxidase